MSNCAMLIVMDETIGRREANKRAVRAAVQQAAKRLFAQQGYEATSVRQIADAAGIAERTFYRYFEGKEGLIADEADRWMAILGERIRQRPPHESAVTAVRNALTMLALEVSNNPQDKPIWLFTNHPRPLELLQKSAPRPLLRFEQTIIDAILVRSQANHDPVDQFAAELTARLSVAILRSVAIRRRQADPDGGTYTPSMQQLIEQAYDTLAAMMPGPAPAHAPGSDGGRARRS